MKRSRRLLRKSRSPRLRPPTTPPRDKTYERERAEDALHALRELWGATDYPEWKSLALYDEQELKEFLGRWIHVRKACDAMFDEIRRTHPGLPGWDPIQNDRPVEDRLRDAES